MFRQDVGSLVGAVWESTPCAVSKCVLDCDFVMLAAKELFNAVVEAKAYFELAVIPGLALPTEEQIRRFISYQRAKGACNDFLEQYPCTMRILG